MPTIDTITSAQFRPEFVRERRAAAGLTMVSLAVRAGISPTTVAQIEHGVCEPRGGTLIRICEVLDVDPRHCYTIS